MKPSDALRRWQTAHNAARMFQNTIADLGVGAHRAHRALATLYRADLDKWTAERDRLYALLTPEDKATADRIAKETT